MNSDVLSSLRENFLKDFSEPILKILELPVWNNFVDWEKFYPNLKPFNGKNTKPLKIGKEYIHVSYNDEASGLDYREKRFDFSYILFPNELKKLILEILNTDKFYFIDNIETKNSSGFKETQTADEVMDSLGVWQEKTGAIAQDPITHSYLTPMNLINQNLMVETQNSAFGRFAYLNKTTFISNCKNEYRFTKLDVGVKSASIESNSRDNLCKPLKLASESNTQDSGIERSELDKNKSEEEHLGGVNSGSDSVGTSQEVPFEMGTAIDQNKESPPSFDAPVVGP